MDPQETHLSVWEKLALFPIFLIAYGNGLWTLLLAPLRGENPSPKTSTHVSIAIIRSMMKRASVRQLNSLRHTFSTLYPAYAKQQGFTPQHLTLSDGTTRAYWIGNPSAPKILLWYHGGGYNLHIDIGHLQLASAITAASPDVAVLIPAYTLAPKAIYPHQLRQGVETLRYTLTELGRRPEDVMIAGDSAGANLALGVVSHILHPHPEIRKLELEGKGLAGAVLLSPWVSFSTEWPSFRYNKDKDYLVPSISDVLVQSFLGGREELRDAYNEPIIVPEGWWEGLEGLLGEVLYVAGGGEVLVDSIRVLGERLEAVHPRLTVVIPDGDWHDRPIASALPMEGEERDAVVSFVESRF